MAGFHSGSGSEARRWFLELPVIALVSIWVHEDPSELITAKSGPLTQQANGDFLR